MQFIDKFIAFAFMAFNVAFEAERTDPSQNRSMKFSMGLPQPAYAFVSKMSGP